MVVSVEALTKDGDDDPPTEVDGVVKGDGEPEVAPEDVVEPGIMVVDIPAVAADELVGDLLPPRR